MTSQSLLFCSLGSLIALLSACAPLVPYSQQAPLQAVPPGPITSAGTVDSAEQKKIKKVKKQVATERRQNNIQPPTEGTTAGNATDPAPNVPVEPAPQKPTYRYALPIPGKEGFVFNPYTNNPVDVRGIPSGTLVRDPQDPNPDHKFRVP